MKLENQKKLELIPEFTLELRKANMKLQSTKIYQLKSIAFYWKINREKLIHIWKIWKKPIIKKTKYKKIMLIHENCNRMEKKISRLLPDKTWRN